MSKQISLDYKRLISYLKKEISLFHLSIISLGNYENYSEEKMEFISTKVENKKSEILAVMFTVAKRDGVANLSMRSIAKEAKMTQAAIHYYFKDKETLLTEFIKYQFSHIRNRVQNAYKESDPPEKKLEGYLKQAENFVFNDKLRFIVYIESWSLAVRNKKLQKIFSEHYEILFNSFSSIVQEGIEKGVFNKIDRRTIIGNHIAFVSGISLAKHIYMGKFDFRKLFDRNAQDLRNCIFAMKKPK